MPERLPIPPLRCLPMPRDLIRAAVAAVLMMALSALAYIAHPRTYLADKYPREKLVDILPQQFGEWQLDRSVAPVPPSPDLQEVIDKTYDETVALTFRNREGYRIMLSLAYGRNQHKGMNTHKPEVCYPAQGFSVTEGSQRGVLSYAERQIGITRLVTRMGSRNEPITYWLLVGDEVTFFGYPHRWAAIRYGLSGIIPDGVLVRVSSIDNNNQAAFAMQQRFVQDMLGAMAPGKLPRLLGTH